MDAATMALKELPHYGCAPPTRPCDREAPMLVLLPGEVIGRLLPPAFQKALLKRGRPSLAVNDPMIAWVSGNHNRKTVAVRHLVETGIVLPYRSHAFAFLGASTQQLAQQQQQQQQQLQSQHQQSQSQQQGGGHGSTPFSTRQGVMFHGRSRTYDFGLRKRVIEVLQKAHDVSVSVKGQRWPRVPLDLRTTNDAIKAGIMRERDGQTPNATTSVENYVRSGLAYRAASMCLSPSGDVISSRRLFDALSAACVPVLVRAVWVLKQENRFASRPRERSFFGSLPFTRSIDWSAITLRFVPNQDNKGGCLSGDAAWLQQWHSRLMSAPESSSIPSSSRHSPVPGPTIRERGHDAFKAHLDYERNPMGVASALLREAGERLAWPPVRDIGDV
uniref:Uncharacterized protein n=1 Tax=Haptolina brevifila TaxID=156173 RepID=A0A7S2G8U9_9EUKA|mmetsp:Transcript_3085/g.6619  ORF Transcript_3085/g.6619 Transcript_3085/m.6619 type:complete len:388 (+) Transcript_3085:185-1348(+)